ncbi:alginate lyase [Opitutaceae bacterium TAV4]|nr:alginate lyase [Opitutaceae bacterium TAV4]RRK00294.1 alginate lyase [Opitutaceae bacterium TAV3]
MCPRLILCFTLSLLPTCPTTSLAQPAPPLINLDYADLKSIRDELRGPIAENSPRLSAYRKLLSDADSILPIKPPSVMDKTLTASSGDKHDFFSIGFYSWPNPDTPDGLPYIRRDGHRNPEARGPKYDKGPYDANVVRVQKLALAWFYSGDEKYAAKAADLLRVWFINPSTRMNPNLNHAASRPGVDNGHFGGIIEGVVLAEMIDYVRLMGSSQSWSAADDTALQGWFRDFTTWLLESPFGQNERKARNNHSLWYEAQVSAYSLYVGDAGRATAALKRARSHIARQIAPDGSLPAELRRSRSLMYTRYALRAFIFLARCGDLAGEDLWQYRSSEGRCLEDAFNFTAPYLDESKQWPWLGADDIGLATANEIIRWPAKIYRTPLLLQTSKNLDPVFGKHFNGRPPNPEDLRLWLLGKNLSQP